MCGQHHHGECACHGGRHHEQHGQEECGCGGHEQGGCECEAEQGFDSECQCGCHSGGHEAEIRFQRLFTTRAERIARLEEYLNDLRSEAKAVEERIAEIKGASA